MEDSENSSDDDFDQEELEVALYSQTHFDTSIGTGFLPQAQTQLFTVGVQELPAKAALTQSLPSKSPKLGDFISFSENFSQSQVQKNRDGIDGKNLHSTSSDKKQCLSDPIKSQAIPTQNTTLSKTHKKIKHPNPASVDSQVDLDTEDLLNLPSTSCSSDRPVGSDKIRLLPFQITKKPKNKTAGKSPVVVIDDEIHEEMIGQGESVAQLKGGKRNAESLPKLEDFLEVSQSGGIGAELSQLHRQKSLTKGEAAIRHRKPQVQVRRPPRTVPVRYTQDSDTATDYSDSDGSPMVTPTKKMEGKNQDSKTVDALQDADINAEYDHSAGSDGEGEEGEEAIEETRPSKASGSKEQPQFVSSDAEETSSSGADSTSEEDSADSDSCEGAIEEDRPVPFMPSLDFNLAGGVSKLLSGEVGAKPETSEGLWKIDEKDRFKDKSTVSRYFAPRPIQCRNCRKEGHLSRDCPEPLRQRCIFCCEEGHQFKTCPQAVCFNCSAPGHKTSDCREPKTDWNRPCDRCWMTGHREEMCPDRWRQFHLSVQVGKLYLRSNHKNRIEKDEKKNPRVYCYNCGKKGHRGYECHLPRMNRFVAASYPFVAHYDKKSDIVRTMLPPGVSMHEVRKDKDLEKIWEGWERELIPFQLSTERKEKCRKELEHRRQGLGEKQEMEEKRGKQDKKKKKRSKHKQEEESAERVRGKDFFKATPYRLSKEKSDRKIESLKLPSLETDLFRPSTSKSAQRLNGPISSDKMHSRRRGGSKGRKRHWDDGEQDADSGDSLDDMAHHQVGNNEWWLDGPAKGKRHKRGSRVCQRQQRNSQYSMDSRDGESRHSAWRDKAGDPDPELPFSRQPDTTFVYVDEQTPSSFTHQAPHVSQRLSHLEIPSFRHKPQPHVSDRGRHQRFWEADRSPPRAAKPMKHSNHHNSPTTKKHRGRKSWPSIGHVGDGVHYGKAETSGKAHCQPYPKDRKGNHPASWPDAHEKRGKKEKTSHSSRGFKPKHDRFVTMKNDCDIRVSMRK